MSRVNRQNYLIRPILTLGAIVATVFVAACSSTPSSDSSAGSDTSGSSEPSFSASEQPSFIASSPAPNTGSGLDCDSSSATPVYFSFPTGASAPGLTGCTNSDQSETTITNSETSDVVWVVVQPAESNPTLDQDFNENLPLASLFFRSYLFNSSNSSSTIEPGVYQTYPVEPADIKVQEAPGLQSAWAVSSLLARATDKGGDQLKSTLEDSGSKLSQAVATCVSAGYDFGQQLQSNSQAQQPLSAEDIQKDLSSDVGIWKGTSDCSEKLEAANEESESNAEVPDLSPHNVQAETTKVPAWEDAGSDIGHALAHDVEDLHLHD